MNFIFILSFISAILCKKFEKVEQYYMVNEVNSVAELRYASKPGSKSVQHPTQKQKNARNYYQFYS